MPWLTFRRHYRNERGWIGPHYADLLPRHLHLDPTFVQQVNAPANLRTLFREVEYCRPEDVENPYAAEIMATPVGTRETTEAQLFDDVAGRIEQVVLENWTPGGVNAVMHSSGWDSRLISWAIRKLAREYGSDWLGTVLFVCTRREAEIFLPLMKHMGWKSDQYVVPNAGAPEGEYFAGPLLDFEGAWRRLNSLSVYATNPFWWPIEWCQRKGLLPGRVPVWHGLQGNNVFGSAMKPRGGELVMARGHRRMYWRANREIFFKGDPVIGPLADLELCKLLISSSVRMPRLRKAVLTYLDPGQMAYHNIHAAMVIRLPLAKWLADEIQARYRESWYGQWVHPEARLESLTTDWQPFWAHRAAASLCDHLLAEGYEIEVL